MLDYRAPLWARAARARVRERLSVVRTNAAQPMLLLRPRKARLPFLGRGSVLATIPALRRSVDLAKKGAVSPSSTREFCEAFPCAQCISESISHRRYASQDANREMHVSFRRFRDGVWKNDRKFLARSPRFQNRLASY